ncbi:MAG: hypothetical protein BGO47_06135 [Microbacterium sp. 67-17]|nr:MAG: hypothetical protein BGO47_06135 [Microbacterium sp. 67-17]
MVGRFEAFIDEPSALRGDRQEYLICAALVETSDCEAARGGMRSPLLPGQVKEHWTDESEPCR